MGRKTAVLLFTTLFFVHGVVLAGPPPLVVMEEDGSPKKVYPLALKFPNGNVTVNANGTVSIADNTSVGGGNSVYLEEGDVAKLNNSSADLTLDFNGTDFDTSVTGSELDLTIASGVTRDTEWDTEAEVQTAWGSVDILLKTEADGYYQPLEATLTDIADGTIAENLVNTANPWADNEVADNITASSYLPLAGGTLTGELVLDETGIEGQPTDALTDCSTFAATGGGIFYDDSEGRWKKCEDNVLSDLDTGGEEVNNLEGDGASGIANTELFIGTGAGTGNYAAMSGDATMANNGAVTIGNDKILEVMLKAVDAAGDEECLTYETTTGDFEWQTCGSGSDTNAVKEYWFPASALLPVEPADGIPPITKTANTNVDVLTISYNDSADECRTAHIKVPSDVQSGSTITFRWIWFSLTATTGSVMWDVRYQSTGAEGESVDGTTTTKSAASDAAQGTVKLRTVTTVTETLTNLGWAANDDVALLVCRDGNGTAGTDDMAGDAELYGFSVEIPRA